MVWLYKMSGITVGPVQNCVFVCQVLCFGVEGQVLLGLRGSWKNVLPLQGSRKGSLVIQLFNAVEVCVSFLNSEHLLHPICLSSYTRP